MAKYIYEGNLDSNNQATSLIYNGQGVQLEDDQPPAVLIGGVIELDDAEFTRLSAVVRLSPAGDAPVPTPEIVEPTPPEEDSTSAPADTIEGKQSSPSASSKKS